jgi:hypothetical protein
VPHWSRVTATSGAVCARVKDAANIVAHPASPNMSRACFIDLLGLRKRDVPWPEPLPVARASKLDAPRERVQFP